jgi:hypothetical protein
LRAPGGAEATGARSGCESANVNGMASSAIRADWRRRNNATSAGATRNRTAAPSTSTGLTRGASQPKKPAPPIAGTSNAGSARVRARTTSATSSAVRPSSPHRVEARAENASAWRAPSVAPAAITAPSNWRA